MFYISELSPKLIMENNSRYFIELKYKRKLEVYGDGNSIKSISVAPFVFETFLKNEKIVN